MTYRYAPILLLLVAGNALAGDATPAPQPFQVGPWHLGMSRDQVVSFAEYGPYAPVQVTGGVETQNALFQQKRTDVSFVFDEGGLKYVHVWKYEGKNYPDAKNAVLELFDLFVSYGGSEIRGVSVSGPDGLDRGAMEVVLDRVLGTARDLSKDAKENYQSAIQITMDMVPRNQPKDSRLHAQWGYISRHDTFYVFLFQDRPNAPPRFSESSVQLEKL